MCIRDSSDTRGARRCLGRYRTRDPLLALRVERPIVIVVLPVDAERKSDDRNADARTVVDHDDALAAIIFFEKRTRNPTRVVADADVAPGPAVDATVDRHRRACAQLDDRRAVSYTHLRAHET